MASRAFAFAIEPFHGHYISWQPLFEINVGKAASVASCYNSVTVLTKLDVEIVTWMLWPNIWPFLQICIFISMFSKATESSVETGLTSLGYVGVDPP
jgi:hypothetical protein